MTSTQQEFDAFWNGLDRELASVPLAVTLQRDSFYSQAEWDVLRMQYDSLEGYRLFAWVSVPIQPKGPSVPVVLRMPDYASVHDIIYTPLRHDVVVVNASYRGQRHSDKHIQASYPGLLTEGIGTPESYLMRCVFGDALRAVDALMGQSIMHVGPLALLGAGLGATLALAVAARRPAVGAVAADTPLALGQPEALEGDPGYPLAELADYLRLHPGDSKSVADSCAPLDLLRVAPAVGCPVLLSLGRRDRGQCPIAIGEELADRLPRCDLRVYDGAGEGGGHEHGLVRVAWLREQLSIS